MSVFGARVLFFSLIFAVTIFIEFVAWNAYISSQQQSEAKQVHTQIIQAKLCALRTIFIRIIRTAKVFSMVLLVADLPMRA